MKSVLLLLFLSILSTSCAAVRKDEEFASASLGSVQAGLAAAPGAPLDRYLAFRAKKKKTNAFGFVQAGRDLWAPFRFEATGGFINSAKVGGVDGFFCLELDGRNTNPLEFYALCAQPINNGLLVFAARNGNSNLGQIFFQGATVVDLAIEHEGQNLKYLVREHGTDPWQQVAQISFLNLTVPLLPSVGVSNFKDGAEVGFDHFRVVNNGDAPNPLTPAQTAARELWNAVDKIAEAMEAVDGANPSTANAAAALSTALLSVDFRITNVNALSGESFFAKYKGRLNAARSAIVSANTAISKNKKVASIFSKLTNAARRVIDAIGVVDPL